MADYEKYYKESIEVLTKYITDTRIMCKKIYKETKQKKEK